MRATRMAAILVAALVALGACTGSSDPDPESATQEAPTADVDETAACRLLTAADRTKLTGAPVDTVVASDARAGGGNQCRWQTEDVLIQVTTLPATAWAKSLPDVVAELEQSGVGSDAKELARAKELLAGADSFTGAEACRAFTTLAEISGEAKGATVMITPVPITDDEVGLSAQMCTGGHLTSIIYSVPGLKETAETDRVVTAVLRSAQQRVRAAG